MLLLIRPNLAFLCPIGSSRDAPCILSINSSDSSKRSPILFSFCSFVSTIDVSGATSSVGGCGGPSCIYLFFILLSSFAKASEG